MPNDGPTDPAGRITEQEYLSRLTALDCSPANLRLDHGGTLVHEGTTITALAGTPHDDSHSRTDGGEVAVADLQRLPIRDLGPVLGEGGMGIVRLAWQEGLDREVAVKTLRPAPRGTMAETALLREAWVTGQLQHPLIVPIHALGVDEDGQPGFVMKQVKGVPWSAAIGDPAAHAELLEDAEPLLFHLGVLERVCQAVHFAHVQGILHRDLKPDNVMLGHFGETYVVDWGLAVAIGHRPRGPLHRASRISAVEGTPGYMAPEMAAADGERIDCRSDVFLLGATLHHLLTGQPPWQGRSVMESLLAAFRCEPPSYGDDVPAELARIAGRAMAADADHRFANADDLRRALADYRHHHASMSVTRRARERLAALTPLLLPHPRADDGDRVASLASEARFGFQLALEQWAENPEARTGLDALAGRMAKHEIESENPNGAATWLALLSEPDRGLSARVDRLREDVLERRDLLLRLRREVDPAIGSRSRELGSLWLGAMVVLYSAVCHGVALATGRMPGYPAMLALFVAYLLAIVAAILRRRGRQKLRANSFQMSIVLANAVALVALLVLGAWLGLPLASTAAIGGLMTAALVANLGAVMPRMYVASAAFAASGLATALWPPQVWLITSLGTGLCGMGSMGWAWSRSRTEPSLTREPLVALSGLGRE